MSFRCRRQTRITALHLVAFVALVFVLYVIGRVF